jgi:hypothetical protein
MPWPITLPKVLDCAAREVRVFCGSRRIVGAISQIEGVGRNFRIPHERDSRWLSEMK